MTDVSPFVFDSLRLLHWRELTCLNSHLIFLSFFPSLLFNFTSRGWDSNQVRGDAKFIELFVFKSLSFSRLLSVCFRPWGSILLSGPFRLFQAWICSEFGISFGRSMNASNYARMNVSCEVLLALEIRKTRDIDLAFWNGIFWWIVPIVIDPFLLAGVVTPETTELYYSKVNRESLLRQCFLFKRCSLIRIVVLYTSANFQSTNRNILFAIRYNRQERLFSRKFYFSQVLFEN